jgi:geranylgeranyl pyrophosphate synthase
MMEKLTLPGIYYQRNSTAEEQQWVRETLGKSDNGDYIEYVEKLQAAGSIDYAQSRGLEFIDRAKHSLSQSDLDGAVIEILAELVDAVML